MNDQLGIWKIETGKMKDIDELETLYDELNDYLQEGINYPGWLKSIYPIRETAEIGVHENNLFVLKIGDKIAGSFILNQKQEEAYNQVNWQIEVNDNQILVIHTLVVHPKFMKLGVSQKIMNFVKTYAMQNEIKSIRLDVAIQNTPAISLYEKCGYKYIGTVNLGLPYEHLKWFKLYELVLDK